MINDRLLVQNVIKNSISYKSGIQKGDIIREINENKIYNILEYTFLSVNDELKIKLQNKDGIEKIVEIKKQVYEDLGIEFNQDIISEPEKCHNKCIFCFVDQLPNGMRKSLYIKDDDSSLSFMNGNFITLTNMSDDDIDRIIKFRISPINISVHTTNPELRIKMLNNKKAGNILDQLKKLSDKGIYINCQIVLCPNINDGDELIKTIRDLYNFYPQISNVAVVPVGITKYRKNKIEIFNNETAKKLIKLTSSIQNEYEKEINEPFVRLADEFYIMAHKELPKYEHYIGFEQLEDGIGMISYFENNVVRKLNRAQFNGNGTKIAFITGTSFYNKMIEISSKIEAKINVHINVYKIVNYFFGDTITVTGLLTGNDIKNQLENITEENLLFIPENVLKADEDVFLDDMSVGELSILLNMKIIKCKYTGEDLIKNIIKEVQIWRNQSLQ